MEYFGIDIGGTSVKYGLVTEQGQVRKFQEYPVAFDDYHTPIIETVRKTSREFLKKAGQPLEELGGIGVSATGQIDQRQGTVAGTGGNIRNWEGTNIKEQLFQEYHLPVTVVNDANCVVLGEKWVGSGRDASNIVAVTIGTGVGGGVLVNGRLLTGSHGFAGELGHFPIERYGNDCTCGNRGCYEQYASMTALLHKFRLYLPIPEFPHVTQENLDGRMIFDMVRKHHELSRKLVSDWIDDIVTGLVGLVHIFNPELVLLGGGVSVVEDLFVDQVRTRLMGRVMKNFASDLTVRRAELGNQAGLIGAVYYLKEWKTL